MGFPAITTSRRWAIYESEEFLRKKGVPAGQKLTIIGDEYA
jgi:hypothetical protein